MNMRIGIKCTARYSFYNEKKNDCEFELFGCAALMSFPGDAKDVKNKLQIETKKFVSIHL